MGDQTTATGVQDNTASAAQDTTTQAQTQNQTAEATGATAATTEGTLLGGAGATEKGTEQTTQQNETTPQDGQKAAEETKPQDKAQAPAEYTDFTMPEGVTASPELLTEFKGVAKEMGLTQEQAQKLVDLQAKAVLASAQEQQALFQQMGIDWANETKKMLGSNFESEMRYAAKARDKFATPELVAVLNDSKLGNHPEMVRLFIAIGKAISEDSFVSGKAAPEKDRLSAMYPTMAK